MNIYNMKQMQVNSFEERQNNVFFETEEFKTRIIELSAGGKLLDCKMLSSVIFYVISGEASVIVNKQHSIIKEGDCLISEPAEFSLTSSIGVRMLGVQINKRSVI